MDWAVKLFSHSWRGENPRLTKRVRNEKAARRDKRKAAIEARKEKQEK